METLRNLYDSGGLFAYKVVFFDSALCSLVERRATFNEDVAKEEVKALKDVGFVAGYKQIMIKFDGAFAETLKPTPEKPSLGLDEDRADFGMVDDGTDLRDFGDR
jgi:hypothetical protein